MISASEAREQARSAVSSETAGQLVSVERCVKHAIREGEMRCFFGMNLNKQSIEYLENLGYHIIDYSNQRDGISYEISW